MSDEAATDDTAAEVARLKAERDAALAEVDRLRQAAPSRHRIRRTAAIALLVVSCLSFLTGGMGIWASRNFLDTDIWVERVGPLADDPDVQAALSRLLTAEVMKLVNPQALFEEVLPERGRLLAGPLSGAVEGFVGDRVQNFVASDTFAKLWVTLNEQAHAAAVKVLRGDSEVLQAGDDTVTLNLLPIINRILARITSVSPELFGRTVDIPDVQIDEVPTAAIDKINDTFGTDLPDDFGQITIYDEGKLKEVQDVVQLFDRIVWLSVAIFVVSTVGAFLLSVDRRRTLLQLSIADVLILILLRRVAITAQDQLLELVKVPANRPAIRAVSDAMLSGLFDGTRILLWGFAAVIVIAWVSGPSARAVAVRHRTASVATGLISTARERGTDPATTAWLVAHRDALQVAGVVVGVVLLWWLDLSWLGVLLLLVAVGAYLVLLARLPEPSAVPAGTGPAASGTGDTGTARSGEDES